LKDVGVLLMRAYGKSQLILILNFIVFITNIVHTESLAVGATKFEGLATPPLGNDFVAIVVGLGHSLVLKSDGSIVGWGSNFFGQATPPPGNDFVAIAAGESHSLALKSDGSIVGWGLNNYGQANPPLGNDFVAIAAGLESSLALKSDGSIVGWGLNDVGQANPPLGNDFVAIAIGCSHSLALQKDGSIVCWGYNEYGQANPPLGNDFDAIAAGWGHNLALKSDGSIVSWGSNFFGEATPPSGNDFVAIAAGGNYSLALKKDGSIVGWGYNVLGQATPPSGNDFVAIAAGGNYSLALKKDGSIVGWGYIVSGQATPPTGNDSVVPSGITDPGRSVWFQVGETNDAVMGLKYGPNPGFPAFRLSIAGVPAMMVVNTPRSQYPFFLDVANWFTATNVVLNIEYYDSGMGSIFVLYDSFDQNAIRLPPPTPSGAWKEATESISCTGTFQWKTGSIHLPDARFSDECNPCWNYPDSTSCDHEDLMVHCRGIGDFPIRAMWITAISNNPPLPRRQIEWVDSNGNVTASRAANDDDRFVLSDTDYEYTFAPAGLLKIIHKPTQTVLASSESPYIPFSLRIHKARTDLSVIMDEMPKTVRVIGDSQPTAIEYVLGCPEMLQATLRIEKVDGGLTRWKISNLSLSPNEGTTLVDVSLPDIRGVAIGGDANDDWCIIPGYYNHGCGVYYNTIEARVPNTMHMAMNWLSLYDQTNQCGIGFYLDDHNDVDNYEKNDVQSGALNIRFSCYPKMTTLPEAYVLVHSGDWHRVADCYRMHVASRDPSPPNPAWAVDMDGWDQWIGNEIERGFTFIPDFYREKVMPRGLRLMDVYRQMYDGPWTYCGDYPYPNAYYGSVEELNEAALRVHDNGGRMIYYINYMLSIPDGPSVKRIGPTSRTLIPTNVPPPYMPQWVQPITDRSYTGMNEFWNDRSSREWSDRDLYWASWYAQNVMADGIYFDQLSCIAGGLKETAWNLGRITTEARQYVPDFITAGEGVGQAHGRNLTFGLASAVFHRTELYRYTFPDHLVMDGTSNGACNWGGGDRRFNVIFLNGCRFDNLPSDETFRNNMMNLRLRTKQLLYQAMFRDTDGVEVTLPADVPAPPTPTSTTAWFARFDGIQAKRFILNTSDSKLVLVNTINTLNAGNAKATVETKDVGTISVAWAFLWDGTLQRIPFQYVSATQVTFDIPTTEQATVVLINVCEPIVSVGMPTMLPPGGQGQTSVSILNLNTNAIQGTITWELPEGWTHTSAGFDSISPGATQTVTMSLAASNSAARQIHDLWCVATTTEGVKGRKYAPVSVVPTPYVKWEYHAGDSLRSTVQNLKSEAATGSVVVEFPANAPVGTIENEQLFNVSGNSETILTFHFTNLSQLKEPIGIHVLVRSGGTQQRIPIRLFPAIANGGFEIDLAGDGKPEYWTTYDYSGKTSIMETYPLINLDPNIKHSGNSSLRIDPLPVSRDAPVFVIPLATMLFPDTHYQITTFAKVPANGSITILAQGWQPLAPVGDPTLDGWQLYAGEFKTGSSVNRNELYLLNNGSTTVWIDDIMVAADTYNIIADIAPEGGDGVVNFLDLAVLAEAWLATATSPNWNPKADLAPDGIVNLLDFAKIAEYWLDTTVP
jgi:alpha-tubulin suppressor-like RCC1 family protein